MTSEVQDDDRILRPPELRAQNAGATVGTAWLFRHLDLTVPSGGWLVILGPSGSGKTTLVRQLAGLLAPAEGEIRVGGVAWGTLGHEARLAFRRKFGYVQQQPGLLHASAVDNVIVPLRWRGMSRDEADRAARESLDAVGLADSVSKEALSLSGGERQRLAFARAMALEPEVLVLDEFTNHQDPRRGDLLEAIVGERFREGASLVMVGHDLRQVDRLRTAALREPSILVLLDGTSRAVDWPGFSRLLQGTDEVSRFLRRMRQAE